MLDSGCLLTTMSSGIASVAHHNPHISAIFVYLFTQELFVDKINFFNILCISDKPRLHQLNITSSRSSTVQAFLTAWIFSLVRGNTIKEGEINYVGNKYKTSPTYQARWNFFFHSLTCISQIFVPNLQKRSKPSAWKLRCSEYLKKYEPCYFDTFCREPAF